MAKVTMREQLESVRRDLGVALDQHQQVAAELQRERETGKQRDRRLDEMRTATANALSSLGMLRAQLSALAHESRSSSTMTTLAFEGMASRAEIIIRGLESASLNSYT